MYKINEKVYFKAASAVPCTMCEQSTPNLQFYVGEGKIIKVECGRFDDE